MVSFTHQDAGTPESDWAGSGAAALPELPLDDGELAALSFIVLAAHPDDESLGAGGLMARLRGLGARVTVLLCTAGEASHPDSPTTTPEQLASLETAVAADDPMIVHELLTHATPLDAARWTYLRCIAGGDEVPPLLDSLRPPGAQLDCGSVRLPWPQDD